MMVDLALIRHPPTHANLEGLIQGASIDQPPIPGFEPRLKEIAEEISSWGNVNYIFSSELRRTIVPALLFRGYLKEKGQNPRYVPSPHLNEKNFGEREGTPLYSDNLDAVGWTEEEKKNLREVLFEIVSSKGENFEHIAKRIDLYTEDLLDLTSGLESARAVIFGHRYHLNYMVNHYLGLKLPGPFLDWENLGVKYARLEWTQTGLIVTKSLDLRLKNG